MANENETARPTAEDLENLPSLEGEGEAAPEGAPGRPAPAPYVRQRPARRSVDPIDDFALEEGEPEVVAHDSAFTTRGGAFSGMGYRRSRAQGKQLRRDLHYGQYLEIPKSRRDILVSRERRTRLRTALALLAVLAVLAIVVAVVWNYMQTNWGATG